MSTKLSILILTHNRPQLFRRCLKSVIENKFYANVADSIEILVNNDSNDIQEITGSNIKYFYNTFEGESNQLTKKYKFLLDSAVGEYVFFLEDDDYLLKDGLQKIWNSISDSKLKLIKHLYMTNERFKSRIEMIKFIQECKDFQLCQVVFNRELLNSIEFPEIDRLDNDYLIFKRCLRKCQNHEYLNNKVFIYRLTFDGGDNISVPKDTLSKLK